MKETQKAFYWLIFGLIIALVSWVYLIYSYSWKVFIPIFCIIWSINIAKKWNLKNKKE